MIWNDYEPVPRFPGEASAAFLADEANGATSLAQARGLRLAVLPPIHSRPSSHAAS